MLQLHNSGSLKPLPFLCLQQTVMCPYAQPDTSSPHPIIVFLQNPLKYFLPIYALIVLTATLL